MLLIEAFLSQAIGWSESLSEVSGGESTSKLTDVVDRIQVLMVVELSCFVSLLTCGLEATFES